MPLAAGTRLGPYEIVAPLGAGGMGEVYRARDPRLGRDVAVKVLPQHLSANPEVRARFEREAKTVSSLAHPNICTLFDVGREGDTDYLVMELVDGETLAQRLARGSLPGPEVLKIGAQIADALDRAHRAGVVHRDLKPGNVMLTRTGARLMDFGLARATGLAPAAAGSGSLPGTLTQSPTVAAALTAEGTLIGTFQYMAPEQLEGKEADARADLWALGCVLYEMATGRRAFEGRSQASLITAIMGTEPPPVSQVAPLAPAGLDRLVRTCLTKDPEDRARSAHDVKLQLLGIAEGASQVSGAGPVAAARPRPASGPLPWIVAGLAVLGAIVSGALLVRQATAPRSAVQLALVAPRHATFSQYMLAALSPDGRSIAFCASDSSHGYALWVQRLDQPEATQIVGTTGGFGLVFWSPDGRSLGFLEQGTRQLVTVPVGGGTPVRLCSVAGPRGGTWSPRGVIVFARQTQGPLYRISPAGGEPEPVTVLDSTRHESGHRFPCFLPDGDHFLFTSLPPGPNGYEIYVGSLSSRGVKRVMTAESSVTWAAPGYLLFRRAGKVMAQRFDPRTFRVSGEPAAIADAPALSDMDAEPVATAANGRVAVLSSEDPDTQLAWLDRGGNWIGRLTLPTGKWGRPVLSPDERSAVLSNGNDLWRVDLSRSVALRLTASAGYAAEPVWSPDGKRIAYTSSASGVEEIDVLDADGSGEPERLKTIPNLFKSPTDWTAEGVLVATISPTTFRDVDLIPPGGTERPLIATSFGEGDGKVSPDGRWIGYVSNEGGPQDVYVQSFPVPGHKVRVTTGGSQVFWWSGNGEILDRSAANDFRSVTLAPDGAGGLSPGPPRILFRYPDEVQYSCPTHDGRRLLVSVAEAHQRDRMLRVILDWTALLGR